MASPDSVVALEFGRYQSSIMERAAEIQIEAGFALEDEDAIVKVLPFVVHPRTEAAIIGLLNENEINDLGERAKDTIDEIYRTGLMIHALVSTLGQYGIRLAVADEDGTAQYLNLGTMGDFERSDGDDRTMMRLLVDTVQDNLVEETAEIDERAQLASSETGRTPIHVQHVGMHAIYMAILEQELTLTELRDVDLMNRSAQVYCILASIQSVGGKLCFIDEQRSALPIQEDLNAIVRRTYFGEGAEPE